jgi:hypothetical protein
MHLRDRVRVRSEAFPSRLGTDVGMVDLAANHDHGCNEDRKRRPFAFDSNPTNTSDTESLVLAIPTFSTLWFYPVHSGHVHEHGEALGMEGLANRCSLVIDMRGLSRYRVARRTWSICRSWSMCRANCHGRHSIESCRCRARGRANALLRTERSKSRHGAPQGNGE